MFLGLSRAILPNQCSGARLIEKQALRQVDRLGETVGLVRDWVDAASTTRDRHGLRTERRPAQRFSIVGVWSHKKPNNRNMSQGRCQK
jgi:hypothetical protein